MFIDESFSEFLLIIPEFILVEVKLVVGGDIGRP